MMICLKSLNPSFWCFLLHWCLIVFFCSWDMFILFNRPNLCDSIGIGCNFAWRKQSDYLDEFFTTPHSKLVIFSPLLMRARVRMPWSILLFFLSLVVWNVCLSGNYSEPCEWLESSLGLLGCTPSIPSIAIGRTHFEATSLLIKSIAYGNLGNQSDIELMITDRLNDTGIGPLGLGGKTTVLGCYLNIGNQRASGVRIVSVRPSCFVEPRVATLKL